MVDHLAQCSACQAEVERLEAGVSLFRDSAVEWSGELLHAQSLSARPRHRLAMPILTWALAAIVLLLVLLPLYLLEGKRTAQQQEANKQPATVSAPISDDALLQQVDDEVSVAVPASMEPLTHLVTTNRRSASSPSTAGVEHSAQTN
jgi:anti-sigma factor RsiW